MKQLYFTKPDLPINEYNIALENTLSGFTHSQPHETHQKKIASYARDTSGIIVAGILGRVHVDQLCIQGPWVSNAIRRQGAGTKLLRLFEHYATENKLHSIIMETTNRALMAFYIKNHYKILKISTQQEPRCSVYRLKKTLLATTS